VTVRARRAEISTTNSVTLAQARAQKKVTSEAVLSTTWIDFLGLRAPDRSPLTEVRDLMSILAEFDRR
jgi:hypothetical protein